MKIRDLTQCEWQRALREDDVETLDMTWYNWDRETPELHDATPDDLRPYVPPGDRYLYDQAIAAGLSQEEAMKRTEDIGVPHED
ncbi:MAG: hypothetical protein GVY30_00095 [Chloroflexi bacterium]|nr:hypothetical protein [Chloroflexota bacterium]